MYHTFSPLRPVLILLILFMAPYTLGAQEADTDTPSTPVVPATSADVAPQTASSDTAIDPPAAASEPAEQATDPESSEPSAAQPDSSAALDEIVVTANRRKSSWKDAPAMVTVIGKDELQQAPEKTVDDFLKRIPSISYSRQHVAECGPGRDITLRGIHEQKRTLILLDGVPVNDGVTGAVNWSLMPPEALERIEIVRGPMSALYGSGAMGGVINLISHKPRTENETTLKGGYGSLDTYTATLLQAGMFEKGGYSLGANLYKTKGYIQAKEPEAYHVKNARTDLSLFGKAYVMPDDRSTLTLGLSFVNEDFSRGIQTDNQNNTTLTTNLTYEREMGNRIDLTATLYGHFLWREVDLGARPDYTLHDHTEFDESKKFGQLFKVDFKVADFNTLTVGIDSAYSTMDKHNEYDLVERKGKAKGNNLSASLFAQDEMDFHIDEHTILLTPGLRVDYFRSGDGESSDTSPGPYAPVDETYQDRSWVAINPKLAFVYRYADLTTLRASVGRSFAAPTLFELYTVFTRGPMLLYSNPKLDPESAWSAEVGLDQWILHNFLGRVTGYYTRGQDFIGSRTIDVNVNRMDNITDVQVMGLDGELRYDINKMWTLYGGYTFNHSTIVKDEADPTIEDNHLPFEPQHRGRLGVQFQYLKWIAIDLSARYEGERFTDLVNTQATKMHDYISLDLGVSGSVIDMINWKLSFENMLNTKYDVYSVPNVPSESPGILVNGSVALNF